jgi:hypothetical protein
MWSWIISKIVRRAQLGCMWYHVRDEGRSGLGYDGMGFGRGKEAFHLAKMDIWALGLLACEKHHFAAYDT